MSSDDDSRREAQERRNAAERTLVMLARKAVRRAWLGGCPGLNTAVALGREMDTYRLPIAQDVPEGWGDGVEYSGWLPHLLREVETGIREHARLQYDSGEELGRKTVLLVSKATALAATMPQEPPRNAHGWLWLVCLVGGRLTRCTAFRRTQTLVEVRFPTGGGATLKKDRKSHYGSYASASATVDGVLMCMEVPTDPKATLTADRFLAADVW